ncbi:UPF0103-domain-containing protein [Xylariaceae sp. FL0804]|nr:UPF0103-domain-containing protein [Xylariaceae sp. FL0804]
MKLSGIREASHAGSWYDDDPEELSEQLDGFLAEVPASIDDQSLPIAGAKVVIAPHAGYTYSGRCAAWAYKCLDLSRAKRIFLLGPSHRYHLNGCALTTFAEYETPFGNLVIDEPVVQRLRDTGAFKDMSAANDTAEHSLEMHLPYIHKRITQTLPSSAPRPTLVPILVGGIGAAREKEFGRLLAPFLADPDNAFVVSSDFCHWGTNYDYLHYAPGGDVSRIARLPSSRSPPTDPPIHESIRIVDHQAMADIEHGGHDAFVAGLRHTENTVCGRHPIGVVMAALEALPDERGGAGEGKRRFKFVQYQRSGLVESVRDYSVSYASAYAIL